MWPTDHIYFDEMSHFHDRLYKTVEEENRKNQDHRLKPPKS